MDGHGFTLELALRDGYEFAVDFGDVGGSGLVIDEAPPLGGGAGPNPARLLAAAVGGCLSASLRFCLEKSGVELGELHTTVDASVVRNERGRLRVDGLDVRLRPGIAARDRQRFERCLAIFEDFCIVTQSVRRGIPIGVTVEPAGDVAVKSAAV